MRHHPVYAPIAQLVREKILEIGYDASAKGFDGASCGVSVSLGTQSPDIAQGVDTAYEKRIKAPPRTHWTPRAPATRA